MALQILFDADEHTAKDGPYSRLISTRKWVYISSILAVLLAADLYDEVAAKSLALNVFAAPSWLVQPAVLFGLIYLLLQYGLLLRQLLATYDIVMGERLQYRRAEELSAAQDRLKGARKEAMGRMSSDRIELESRLTSIRVAQAEVEKRIRNFDNGLQRFDDPERRDGDLMALLDRSRGLLDAEQEAYDRLAALTSDADHEADTDVAEAYAALQQLQSQNPADRRGYRQAEVAIDVLRLVPPLVIGLVASTKLGFDIVT